MKYMRLRAFGSFPEYTISDDNANDILNAKEINSNLVSIEEKFDFVVGNYHELMEALLSNALKESFHEEESIATFYINSRKLNRYVFNLLSSSTLYINQVNSNIKQIDITKCSVIKDKIQIIKNKNISSKLMSALRDHLQHAGIATYGGYGFTRIDSHRDNEPLLFYSTINLVIDDFKKDSKIKKILPEILQEDKDIDITQYIMDYFQSINELHILVRESLKEKKEYAQRIIDFYIEEYAKIYSKIKEQKQKLISVLDEDENLIFYFSRNSIEIIQEFVSKNSIFNNVNQFVITNITKEKISTLRNLTTASTG